MQNFSELSIWDCMNNPIIFEFENGRTVCLQQTDNVQTETNESSVKVTAVCEEYKAEIFLMQQDENYFSVRATVTPVESPKERLYKLSSFSLILPYEPTMRLLSNHPFHEGVIPVGELPDSCCCKDFCSLYQASQPDRAVTVIAALPAKFKSEIAVSSDETALRLYTSTIIPYSYAGEVICQEWLVYINRPTTEALIMAAEQSKTPEAFSNPIGWSTWDYYFTSATEEDVKANVDFIASDKILSEKVHYIAIDDGWQQREGDWRSGIRYPSGLKKLVDYIKERGFEAGIWIAPTRLHYLSGTVMRRHDFLVRDAYGDPITDEDMYVLDPTHPDGEKFLRETFRYLASCGFTFYKLDFVANLLNCAERFYDPVAGPFDALARVFAIARETVPLGSHIMGCSLPYGAGVGFADSRRTGWDIHNVWGHVIECVAAYLPQFAVNGRIYRNDLDYLVVRGGDTSADRQTNVLMPKAGYTSAHPSDAFVWRAGRDFSYIEAKTWCAVLLMAGSSVFLGDNLPLLNELGLNLVRKTVAAADFCSAVPVFGAEKLPAVWYKREFGKLYIFNFTDEMKEYYIDLKNLMPGCCEKIYTDLFTEQIYKAAGGILSVMLPPHDSLCLL